MTKNHSLYHGSSRNSIFWKIAAAENFLGGSTFFPPITHFLNQFDFHIVLCFFSIFGDFHIFQHFQVQKNLTCRCLMEKNSRDFCSIKKMVFGKFFFFFGQTSGKISFRTWDVAGKRDPLHLVTGGVPFKGEASFFRFFAILVAPKKKIRGPTKKKKSFFFLNYHFEQISWVYRFRQLTLSISDFFLHMSDF